MYIIIIVFYLKVELIINGNKHKLMIIKELFEGLVWDYCIACNTIKCLLNFVWDITLRLQEVSTINFVGK